MKRKICKIKWFAGPWVIIGTISKIDKTVLPSFRGKTLCLNSAGMYYYASPSEMEMVPA